MPAPRAKLKIYATTSVLPSADVDTLIGARRRDFGSFQVYVLAPSKLKAGYYINDAFQKRGVVSDRELTVAAENLDTVHNNDLSALVRAGLFADDGDVVATDRDHHAGVVRVAGAVEANGDPERVGEWKVALDADDFPVKGFHRADGVVFAEPVDELHKRMELEARAQHAADEKLRTETPGAIERVEAFLALREPEGDPSGVETLAYVIDEGNGRADLTLTDLRTLVEAARKLGSR